MIQDNGSGNRDFFLLARGADFVPYAEVFLGVVFTSLTSPKCLCPFHEDKSPSFSVKVSGNFGKCFTCGERANIVDFTAVILGIKPIEAAIKICEDLSL